MEKMNETLLSERSHTLNLSQRTFTVNNHETPSRVVSWKNASKLYNAAADAAEKLEGQRKTIERYKVKISKLRAQREALHRKYNLLVEALDKEREAHEQEIVEKKNFIRELEEILNGNFLHYLPSVLE